MVFAYSSPFVGVGSGRNVIRLYLLLVLLRARRFSDSYPTGMYVDDWLAQHHYNAAPLRSHVIVPGAQRLLCTPNILTCPSNWALAQ